MFSKVLSKSAVSVLGVVFVLSICIGLTGGLAMAQECVPGEGPDGDKCCNNEEFTTDFRLDDCKFKDKGVNPYFSLEPGDQSVLASDDEKVVITVLHDKKTITLLRAGKKARKIKTRVVEEREFKWEEGKGDAEGEWVIEEISRNYFAICKMTNAVYYFGELSLDDEGEIDDGSWEAGVDDAMPGLIMPGTILLGAKYFQEQAPENALDRGQIEEMDLGWSDDDEFNFEDCIKIVDTNPVEGDCAITEEDEADIKIYCPGVGLVQDEELVLVWYGYK